MTSSVLSFLGWTFLPDLITSALQVIYYGITIRAGDPKPQSGTPKHALHQRRIHIGVTLIYLFYSLFESHWDITHASDFYSVLGVSPAADDRTIQSKFRRLTLIHHPDKVPPTTPRDVAETYYISLQTARDILLSPAQRYAYDRFGPQSLGWKHKKTAAEYIIHGLQNAFLPYYGASGIVLLCFGYLGMLSYGTYWRYLAFVAMAAFELRTVTGLAPPLPCVIIPATIRRFASLLQRCGLPVGAAKALASYAPEPYLPFQVLEFFHGATVAIFLAVSRLGPLLEEHFNPGKTATEGSGSEDAKLNRLVTRLETAVSLGGTEIGRQLALETVPLSVDGTGEGMDTSMVMMQKECGVSEVDAKHKQTQWQGHPGAGAWLAMLKGEVKDWLVNNTIRSDPQVSAAFTGAIARRSGQVGESDGVSE